MRVVTTCHKAGFDEYGHRLLETWANWRQPAELVWYTEGYTIPETPNVRTVELGSIPALTDFKATYAHYQAPSWEWAVVRFAHKVFAMIDACMDYDGLAVWLDADCTVYQKPPKRFIESLLPEGAYIGLFQRAGTHTETGFWLVDCSNPKHKAFMQTWERWYTEGAFKQLPMWTDCHTLDATVRRFKDQVGVVNLSGQYARDMHPIVKSELGKYIDHAKGGRKATGVSPENVHRQAA